MVFVFQNYFLSAQTYDTLFFETLKQFYNKKAGYVLNKHLFTTFEKNDSMPYNYIYISEANKVKNALPADFIYATSDTAIANKKVRENSRPGTRLFLYKTFGTSDARLTKNLVNYSAESKAFIVFHELTHNYFSQRHTPINYHLNEATCDVLGKYFSRKLLKETKLLDKEKLKEEIRSLEAIYTVINSTIKKIAQDSVNTEKYCREAEPAIKKEIGPGDSFFKDRFYYTVTTAYLLKNQFYCKYYFKVSKLYRRSRNFDKFIYKLVKYNKTLPHAFN